MPLLPPAHSSTSGSRVIHRWTLTVAKGTACFPCLSPSSPAEISAEVKRLCPLETGSPQWWSRVYSGSCGLLLQPEPGTGGSERPRGLKPGLLVQYIAAPLRPAFYRSEVGLTRLKSLGNSSLGTQMYRCSQPHRIRARVGEET